MRALLVVNPKATTTSERSRDVLVRALRSEVDLTVAYTRRRGHATALARDAAADGVDLVVTLGGDGTVNEAVNGLMAGGDKADNRPGLAVVPGGSTNVFARAVGMPRDWADGASMILEALQEERFRVIGLGRADDRYFTFCAGLGLDAEVVARVEKARHRGRTSTPALYLRSALAQYFLESKRRQPPITLERPGERPETNLATVIVQNTAPWTYLGDRPVNPCPDASFETGLDVMALRELHVPSTARTAQQILARQPHPHGKRILGLHDLETFTLRADHPIAFQLDGDYLGEREKIEFHSIADALRIVC
ncbi:diacylglycerol kinase family lipid kinase [Planosporangium flavigriseum]|uniref:Diacylglycerol kinase n=1 Tax=Planosporangium flavigriseum TaxID=373681 RepID=A0A8J3PPA7_9ACTN|nr:diacylglycerol kinase family protein [Planosporangium flavigriseum]NJC66694.1 diacylglycerol kinase family lipid kinase [Planosporangium flavigriseum]GIG74846.1 diacylglycerol kinase [Planosporangium flavigriseum]